MDILERIVADKRLEVAAAKAAVPEDVLRRRLAAAPAPLPFKEALAASPHGIIAEFKRKSPSRGWIHKDIGPDQVVPAYAAAGAAALSILTDGPYFGGCLDYIVRMRPLVNVPILRKEFIIDTYQLVEARAAGADAVLLIASCLSREACASLLAEAHSIGLQVLLEVHTVDELDYVTPDVDAVGVNNRHLGTFHTDVQVSLDLAAALRDRGLLGGAGPVTGSSGAAHAGPSGPFGSPTGGSLAGGQLAPAGPIAVSESGISSPAVVRELRRAGYRGFLMGECFMKEPDPAAALTAFASAI